MSTQQSRTSVIHERFHCSGIDELPIYGDVRIPEHGDDPLPVIVIAHGFKGFKDWGFFPRVGARLAEAGFATVTFNFTMNGVEGHSEEFSRLDLFEQNTFSREVTELRRVIDHIAEGDLPGSDRFDASCIGTLGHSRGGGIVLLEAADDTRVGAVATWAAVSTFHRYTPAQLERWKNDGHLDVPNARTGQIMKLGKPLLDEILENGEEIDIRTALSRIDRPLLIAHGAVDVSVDPDSADVLFGAANATEKEIFIVPRTGHTFGAVHPFEGETEALTSVIERTADFFGRQLQ